MPGGRPTTLTDEIKAVAVEYLEGGWMHHGNGKLATVERLALVIGVSRTQLYKWAKLDEQFGDTLAAVTRLQRSQLVEGGFGGEGNAGFAKFLLNASHGLRETQEIDHRSGDGSMSPPSAIVIVAAGEDEDGGAQEAGGQPG